MEADFPTYKTVSINTLMPYARNSRIHSDAQITKIAASIKEFGFLNPVIIDSDNGIVAGHGRVLAAKKLGMAELPVIEANHLTEAQRRAYVIADNRLALDSAWNDEILKIELAEIQELGLNLEFTGFSLYEIDSLILPDRDDSLFDIQETHLESPEKSKTQDGYSEIAIVLTVENKKLFIQAINNIKKIHGISSSEDALMVMCDEYLK